MGTLVTAFCEKIDADLAAPSQINGRDRPGGQPCTDRPRPLGCCGNRQPGGMLCVSRNMFRLSTSDFTDTNRS